MFYIDYLVHPPQKNAEIDDPKEEDLFSYGCESKILQLLKLPDGTVKVLVEGFDRVKIIECKDDKEYLTTSTEVVKDKVENKEDLLPLSIVYNVWAYNTFHNQDNQLLYLPIHLVNIQCFCNLILSSFYYI